MISLMNHINSDRDNPLFALAFSSEGELYGYLETKTLDVLLMRIFLWMRAKCRWPAG